MERQMAFVLRLFGAYAMLSGALHSATGAIVVFVGGKSERIRREGVVVMDKKMSKT